MSDNSDFGLKLKTSVELANEVLANYCPQTPSAIISGELEAMNEQNEKIIRTLQASNEQLVKLVQAKEKEAEDAKIEAEKAKRYNFWMMVIAIISMLVAIAAWITTLIQGGMNS